MTEYQERKYILKKVTSKKSLKDQISTPSLSQTDYEHQSCSGLKDSCSELERKITELQTTNQKLRQELARMKYIQEQLQQCRRQIEQLSIQKDFYMRAYKTLKKQSGEMYKESIIREKSEKQFHRQSRQKAFTGYESSETFISIGSRKDIQIPRQSSRYKRIMFQQQKPYLIKQKIHSSSKSKIPPSLPSPRHMNTQQDFYLMQKLNSKRHHYSKPSQNHPYGFISRSKQKYRSKYLSKDQQNK